MKASAQEPAERIITIEMTESEATMLMNFVGSGNDDAYEAYLREASWLGAKPTVRVLRALTSDLYNALFDVLPE